MKKKKKEKKKTILITYILRQLIPFYTFLHIFLQGCIFRVFLMRYDAAMKNITFVFHFRKDDKYFATKLETHFNNCYCFTRL